uniref:RIN4 pathogenic type III effector avirulence factor Avr cleavage site domain-containing protein n=1 Tax=Oryza nivara TaxID=4536 RepID=A0A0E0J9L3_ORYNI
MEKGRRRHIPAFGEWNQQCEELPITQYFDSAMEQGLVVTAGHYYHATAGELLFKVAGSPPPQKPPKKASILWPVRSTKNGMENQAARRRDGPSVVVDGGVVVHGSRRPRVVRAVDEDLYKVPSELLRKKAKGVHDYLLLLKMTSLN